MILNEEYLESKALSQSMLKKLLAHPQLFLNYTTAMSDELDEPKETTTIGDAVDIILTQGDDVFYNNFYITEAEKPTAMMGTFVWELYINRENSNAEQIAYEKSGFKIKIEKVRERYEAEGRMYYESLLEAEGKSTLTTHQYSKVTAIVESLRTNPFTADWINGTDNLEVHKQVVLDFDYRVKDKVYKCKGLVDLLVIDKTTRVAYPIDIKTSSSATNSWLSMFWKFRYDLQAAFYTYGIKNTPSLKALGFTDVYPFRFIVENQDFPGNPLIYQMGEALNNLGMIGGVYENRVYEGFHQAIVRYDWHLENDLWQYKMEDYINKGIRILG
jgi:hypothetical protein